MSYILKVVVFVAVVCLGMSMLISGYPDPNADPGYYGYYDYYGKYGNSYYGNKHGHDGHKGHRNHHHQQYGYY